MNVLERKNHLHQLVVETNDDLILEKVELFFEQLLHDSTIDWFDAISAQERGMIEAGLKAAAGRFVPHEVVQQKALKILNGNFS